MVFELKERIFVLFVILAGICLALSPMCNAFASVTVYGYTDKPYYKPGDTGTLHFWIYNSGTDDLIFKNLTIYYPWYNAAGFWTGNVTIVPSTATVIPAGGNWSSTSSFTVPNDGRVAGSYTGSTSSITFNVVTDKTTQTSTLVMSVASTPLLFSLQNMDQLMTWIIILGAAIIVCILITALAIIVSSRRTHVHTGP